MEFETVIGLEIHSQLRTNTKIFCSCQSIFGDQQNSHGCPVCLGLPGALPVLNRKAVDMAVLMGHAIGCTINEKSVFARKNYFYPDLPKGYQISQYDLPICEFGKLDININGETKRIGITRIHLEEDAGKLIHDQDVDTLFDVNRCGTPLIEIVTEPDIRSPKEAYEFLTSLRQILSYLDVSDCNMEEGSLRCDANISIRPVGQKELGTRTELKNMNSFHGVEKALEYEVKRQTEVIMSGGEVVQQTYLWDAQKNVSVPMRSKEDAHDYRYFPDPDLVPLIVTKEHSDQIKATLPELPAKRLNRFMEEYDLSLDHATVLTDTKDIADYFEETIKNGASPKASSTWVMGDVLRIIKDKKINLNDLNVSPKRLAEIIKLISDGTISSTAARKVFDSVEELNKEPNVVVDELGLKQISDSSELEKTIDDVLNGNPKEVERFKAGEKKLTGFFMGQVMRATKGKGNPKEISKILNKKLNS